jgi:hypothetical protein
VLDVPLERAGFAGARLWMGDLVPAQGVFTAGDRARRKMLITFGYLRFKKLSCVALLTLFSQNLMSTPRFGTRDC